LKTVLVFGTFDSLHTGHLYFLSQARRRGKRLVVSVARDQFVSSVKGKTPEHGERSRIGRLRESGLADEVYLSDPVPGSYGILRKVRPDLICLGYDQEALEESLRSWLERRRWLIPLVRLERKPKRSYC
jgi:FAD synthetase